ncbi:MAG: GTPase HflX [Tissierellales bacterium]|nr:GTPase HflX [Tissierellales bacterium]
MENTLLVAVELPGEDIETSLDELNELVKAAGGKVVASVVQKRDKIDAKFFIGSGKVEEIKDISKKTDIDLIVFNNELSPAQLRNLEEAIEIKIIDRTMLILDIFSKRAVTKEGKLQVELAQLKYILPRLTGMRDYLSREGGGIGTRGPGEQKLEIDRRHIQKKINTIEIKLKQIEKEREIKRNKRNSSNLPVVALVGYTNSGKSTILNNIIRKHSSKDKSVYAKDMLFATLDTAHRKARLENGDEVIFVDTVGFVSNLPTKLVEAFKSTLEEIKYADLLVHVIDISNKNIDLQIKTTMDIIKDLGANQIPIINVFNKTDKVSNNDILVNLENIGEKIYISALDDKDISYLLNVITERLKDIKSI